MSGGAELSIPAGTGPWFAERSQGDSPHAPDGRPSCRRGAHLAGVPIFGDQGRCTLLRGRPFPLPFLPDRSASMAHGPVRMKPSRADVRTISAGVRLGGCRHVLIRIA